MAVAAVKHILHKHAGPRPLAQSRHHHRLGIGWKAGIGSRADGPDSAEPFGSGDMDGFHPTLHLAARLGQDRRYRGQLPPVHPGDLPLPAGCRYCGKVCSGHDPVGQYGMLPSVKGNASLYDDD